MANKKSGGNKKKNDTKKASNTNIWQWIWPDQVRLRAMGGLHQSIVTNKEEFFEYLERDPISAEIAVSEGIEAARVTGELRWVLFLRHWRLQLWSRQRQARRMLPEAIDLLTLATDEQVRDVPQRICVYHDTVDCYLNLDPVGYYEEIVENAQYILDQLPTQHTCATCARSVMAQVSAANQLKQDAEHWLKQTQTHASSYLYSGLLQTYAYVCSQLGQWDEARQHYEALCEGAEKRDEGAYYLSGLIGLATVALARKDLASAADLLHRGRQHSKHHGGSAHLALLLNAEGQMAEAMGQRQSACEYFTQAARLYHDLGCYRDAADNALQAATLARATNLAIADEALTIAAGAAGELPPASRDIQQRLRAFGREPLVAEKSELKNFADERRTPETLEQQELGTMRALLQTHIADRQLREAATMLFRIGLWHSMHNQERAAIDYLILNAALERLQHLPAQERADALEILASLRKDLPAGTVEAALTALENEIPSWLAPLLSDIEPARWRWLLRTIAGELTGAPPIEPEPESEDAEDNFLTWIEHAASLTTLVVRFYDQCEPAELQPWLETLTGLETEMQQSYQEWRAAQPQQESEDQPENDGRAAITLVSGLRALCQGESVEEVQGKVLPPFNQIIEQIGEISAVPIWRHPGNSPLDYFVEQAAQKAVRALRLHDEHRQQRLGTLALRYKLTMIDLESEDDLKPFARLLGALRDLVLANGEKLPEVVLDQELALVLKAVYEAGKGGYIG